MGTETLCEELKNKFETGQGAVSSSFNPLSHVPCFAFCTVISVWAVQHLEGCYTLWIRHVFRAPNEQHEVDSQLIFSVLCYSCPRHHQMLNWQSWKNQFSFFHACLIKARSGVTALTSSPSLIIVTFIPNLKKIKYRKVGEKALQKHKHVCFLNPLSNT